MKFSIQKHNGYQFKILLQTLLGVAVVVLIDFLTGFSGWSVKLCVAVSIYTDRCDCHYTDDREQQKLAELYTDALLIIVLSIIPFILRHFGISSDSIICLIALCVAVFVFVGSVIVGGRRAMDELYRRFHV